MKEQVQFSQITTFFPIMKISFLEELASYRISEEICSFANNYSSIVTNNATIFINYCSKKEISKQVVSNCYA